jgi:hypothetical protein
LAGPESESATDQIRRELSTLANDDVTWDANALGLAPRVMSESARHLLDQGEAAIPALLDALDDPTKFVLSHVLLTLATGVRYDLNPWNGLDVDMRADGSARIDPSQQTVLARRWRRWFASSPRPAQLGG